MQLKAQSVLLLFLLGATAGSALDAFHASSGVEHLVAGAFSYLHPDFIGVPYWLPCLYACASLAVGDVGRSLLFSFRRQPS